MRSCISHARENLAVRTRDAAGGEHLVTPELAAFPRYFVDRSQARRIWPGTSVVSALLPQPAWCAVLPDFSDSARVRADGVQDQMIERHFVAYGVRIGLRVDCRALLDTLEHDPARTCRSAGAPLKTTSPMLPCPSGTSFLPAHRVERGRHTVCMPERTLSRKRPG